MNYTNNFKIGTIITIKGLGYNGVVYDYDVNGTMLVEWFKWSIESYKTPEFNDRDMIEVDLSLHSNRKWINVRDIYSIDVSYWYC